LDSGPSTAAAAVSGPGNVSRSISIALKRLTQPFHFKTGAKQREQAPHKYNSTLDHQLDVGFPAQFWKMPENDNGEQCTTKDETEAA
jgi:hypothetical protein